MATDAEVVRRRAEYIADHRLNLWPATRRLSCRAWWGLKRFAALEPKGGVEWGLWWARWVFIAIAALLAPSLPDAIRDAQANGWDMWRFRDQLVGASDWPAKSAAAVIVGVQLYLWFYAKVIAGRRRRGQKRKASERIKRTASRVLESMGQHFDSSTATADFMSELEGRVLKIIVLELQLHYKQFDDGFFEATLLTFEGQSAPQGTAHVRISARADAQRQIGKQIDPTETIAWYVAQTGKAFVEANFRDGLHPFAVRGLAEPGFPYASILAIPCLRLGPNHSEASKAVITIDCSEPFFFSRREMNTISTKVQPYVNLISMLLESNASLHPVAVQRRIER